LVDKEAPTDKPIGSKRGPYKNGIERQKQILEATRKLFIEDGYHNFSFRKVARSIGISPGNLQHHFATRDDLVGAMLDYVVGNYLDEIDRLKHDSSSPKTYFLQVLRHIIKDLQTRDTTLFFPELWSLSNHDESVDRLMQRMYDNYRMVYVDIALQINPKLSRQNANVIALFISSSIEGHTVFIGHGKPHFSMCESIIKIIYQTSLNMIENPEVLNDKAKIKH
jgi:AcrR family transcriptional regulator